MEEGGCKVVLTAKCQYMVHMWGHTLRIFITNSLNKTDKCARHEAISNYIYILYCSVTPVPMLISHAHAQTHAEVIPKRDPACCLRIVAICYCSCIVYKNDNY